MKAITAREAEKIAKVYGLDLSGDGTTFYAYSFEDTEIFAFDTKKERDAFIEKANANKEQTTKKYKIYGIYKLEVGGDEHLSSREVDAVNIAKAIEQFNGYNKKILGAAISEAWKVYELAWSKI